jgi:hypothetical protein
VHRSFSYHYWFSGSNVPQDHLVMHKILVLVLQDGQPFML